MDLKLNAVGDIDITDGELSLTQGAEAVKQHLRIRYRFFLGEWFLDTRIGVAWVQTIFRKGTPDAVTRSILRRVMSRTPGIRSVSRFDARFDKGARKLTVDPAEGLLEPGIEGNGAEPFVFEFDDFVLRDQVLPENPGVT